MNTRKNKQNKKENRSIDRSVDHTYNWCCTVGASLPALCGVMRYLNVAIVVVSIASSPSFFCCIEEHGPHHGQMNNIQATATDECGSLLYFPFIHFSGCHMDMAHFSPPSLTPPGRITDRQADRQAENITGNSLSLFNGRNTVVVVVGLLRCNPTAYCIQNNNNNNNFMHSYTVR